MAAPALGSCKACDDALTGECPLVLRQPAEDAEQLAVRRCGVHLLGQAAAEPIDLASIERHLA